MRKADVVVGTTGGVPVKRTVSDVDGHYAVDGLAAGRYRVAAGRAGYLPALSNTVVSLKTNEIRHNVNIAMDKPATISGHILDAEGDPVERVKLTAFRTTNGTLTRAGNAESNDRGEYRIAGLVAGSYVLHTSQVEMYGPVFYPSALDFAGATPVNIGRGSEARDIDLRVAKLPNGDVAGVVHGPARQLVAVRIARRSTDSVMWALPEAEQGMVTEGRFSFTKLAPGVYIVTASLEQTGGRLLWASREVVVNGNATETELALQPARELEGTVDAPAAVVLKRVTGLRSPSVSNQNGKLTFRNITPGTWDVEVAPASEDAFIDSVKWGEQEVIGKQIEIGTGALPKLQIHIGVKGGTLEGTGGFVSLMPESGGRALEAVAGDDGRYRIRGIRPGKYRLACTDELIEVVAGSVVKRDCPN